MKTKTIVVTAVIGAAALSALAYAAEAQNTGGAYTEYLETGKTIDKITCQDFMATEDKFKPETLSYAIGYGQHGHARDAVVDVGGINRMVPVVVQSCRAHPTDSLTARLATMGH